MNYEEMIKKIESHMSAVVSGRDKLDETIMELEQLRDNCETAYDDLYRALDALSELV